MALTPPANTEIATMQALQMTKSELLTQIERVEERLGARIDTVEERTRAYTWKVVVGTGIGLYLAMTATMVGLS
jgi:hypothetical protein